MHKALAVSELFVILGVAVLLLGPRGPRQLSDDLADAVQQLLREIQGHQLRQRLDPAVKRSILMGVVGCVLVVASLWMAAAFRH